MTGISIVNTYIAPQSPPPSNPDANETNEPTQSPPAASDTQSDNSAGTASDQSGAGAGNGTNTGGSEVARARNADSTAAQRSDRSDATEQTLRAAITVQALDNDVADTDKADLERARQSAIAAAEQARTDFLIEELRVKSPQEQPISNLVELARTGYQTDPDPLKNIAEGG